MSQIQYTDYVGLMMSSVTKIINTITYVLIAFVAISLIVSSIMIGVITLISVQERTKEIGILRAIGASKRMSPVCLTPRPSLSDSPPDCWALW
ncbi:MAG: ABC transporter permease [Ruminococcus callidus]